jgi:hypothetical protein
LPRFARKAMNLRFFFLFFFCRLLKQIQERDSEEVNFG